MIIKSAKNGFALPLFLIIFAIGIISYLVISLNGKPVIPKPTIAQNEALEALGVGTTEPTSPPSPTPSPSVADTTAPYIAITNPQTSWERVSGVVTVIASAHDDTIVGESSGITKVEFYIDNKLIGTDTSPDQLYNYSATWDTTNLPSDYFYNITAKAYDGAGNAASISKPVLTAQPVVTITNPTAGKTVKAGDTITITASVTGNIPLFKFVGILIDSSYLCTDNTLPYSCKWKVSGAQDRYRDGKITVRVNVNYSTNLSSEGQATNEVIVNYVKSK